MLPFLKPKQLATTIMQMRKKDGSTEAAVDESQPKPESVKRAEDMLAAIANKDAMALARLLDTEKVEAGE